MKLCLIFFVKFHAVLGNLQFFQSENTLETAVESLFTEFTFINPIDIHFIANSTDFNQNMLMKNISNGNLKGALSTSNSTKRPLRTQLIIIIINEIESSMEALKNVRNVDKFYLIVVLNGANRSVENIFENIWSRKNILNVNVMVQNEKNVINLVTFFPFIGDNCNTTNIYVINNFMCGKWESRDFFPNKLKDFHNCTLRLGTVPAFPATNQIKHKNGTIEYFGSDMKIVNELSRQFNYQNEIFFDTTWGDIYENLTGVDMLGRLLDRKHDYICGWYFLTQLKTKVFNIIQPYFFVPFVVVVPPGQFNIFLNF
jgi:hypothetical protein